LSKTAVFTGAVFKKADLHVSFSDLWIPRPQKSGQNCSMASQLQSLKLAWFVAIFIGTNYSRLASKRLGFFGENRQTIPQVLRYTLS
jgi:hypothetical protein